MCPLFYSCAVSPGDSSPRNRLYFGASVCPLSDVHNLGSTLGIFVRFPISYLEHIGWRGQEIAPPERSSRDPSCTYQLLTQPRLWTGLDLDLDLLAVEENKFQDILQALSRAGLVETYHLCTCCTCVACKSEGRKTHGFQQVLSRRTPSVVCCPPSVISPSSVRLFVQT